MKKKLVYFSIALVVLAGLLVWHPEKPVASYIATAWMDAILELADAINDDGMRSSPDLIEYTINAAADTIAAADSILYSVDISGYREIYLKVCADSCTGIVDFFCYSSETGTTNLSTGNPVVFPYHYDEDDILPHKILPMSKADLGLAAYWNYMPLALMFPVADEHGNFIIGSHMVIKVMPESGSIYNMKLIAVMRK